ncbi:hypothetical protein RFI_06733 [Reticulomyxa filosa]|uniref:Uncharacterized protein n=1 Tax=Reticulomyxa filosa TaxID=46433 RepID=X6NYP7_RETFI|nr:hypothetical protein RFI_06733 [Reticulomyxa filosa]|eukprot:ETO30387.1 hypothetical protein RFI_06733 [Reticulomyxa filosa]
MFFNNGHYKVYATVVKSTAKTRETDVRKESDTRCKRNTKLVVADEIPSPTHFSSLQKESKDMAADTIWKKMQRQVQENEEMFQQQWQYLGKIENPGWFFDRSIIRDRTNAPKACVLYDCTSRTGDLLKMCVVVPKLRKSLYLRIHSLSCQHFFSVSLEKKVDDHVLLIECIKKRSKVRMKDKDFFFLLLQSKFFQLFF